VSDWANPRGSAGSKTSSTPRAVIHKKILEAAGEMPDAPMTEVAGEVSGASTDLVERVLREYGDPAAVESDPEEPTASDGGSASTNGLSPEDDHTPVGSDAADIGSQAGATTADATGGESTESVTDTSDPGTSGTETRDPETSASGESGEPGESGAEEPEDYQSGTEESEDDQSGADRVSAAVTAADRPDAAEESASEETGVSSPDELTEKERAVLQVVAERPTATQQEVADVLDVSRATVSKRASGIEGFDWQRRAAFVERVFDCEAALTRGAGGRSTVDPGTLEHGDARADGDRVPAGTPSDTDESGDVTAEVLSRLDRIEDRLDGLESDDQNGSSGGITDPKLAHKVVHACMESDHVSEDEELRVVAAVLNGTTDD